MSVMGQAACKAGEAPRPKSEIASVNILSIGKCLLCQVALSGGARGGRRKQANIGLARQHSLFLFPCQEVFSNANASARADFFVFLDFVFCFAFNRSSRIYILQIQIINENN